MLLDALPPQSTDDLKVRFPSEVNRVKEVFFKYVASHVLTLVSIRSTLHISSGCADVQLLTSTLHQHPSKKQMKRLMRVECSSADGSSSDVPVYLRSERVACRLARLYGRVHELIGMNLTGDEAFMDIDYIEQNDRFHITGPQTPVDVPFRYVYQVSIEFKSSPQQLSGKHQHVCVVGTSCTTGQVYVTVFTRMMCKDRKELCNLVDVIGPDGLRAVRSGKADLVLRLRECNGLMLPKGMGLNDIYFKRFKEYVSNATSIEVQFVERFNHDSNRDNKAAALLLCLGKMARNKLDELKIECLYSQKQTVTAFMTGATRENIFTAFRGVTVDSLITRREWVADEAIRSRLSQELGVLFINREGTFPIAKDFLSALCYATNDALPTDLRELREFVRSSCRVKSMGVAKVVARHACTYSPLGIPMLELAMGALCKDDVVVPVEPIAIGTEFIGKQQLATYTSLPALAVFISEEERRAVAMERLEHDTSLSRWVVPHQHFDVNAMCTFRVKRKCDATESSVKRFKNE